MKILVPTDFSGCADLALEAAIQIAGLKKQDIILYHSPDLPGNWIHDPVEIKVKDKLNKSILLELKNELSRRQKLVESAGISCRYIIGTGKMIKNIPEIAEEQGIELLVMGSHGVSGKNEWFIGSNTQKVLRRVNCNVLVVKDRIEKISFKRVLFASSLSNDDREALIRFLLFMREFEVEELHLIAINTSGFFNQPGILMEELLQDFARLVKDIPCRTHFFSDYSVESGIRHFSEEHNIDLVAISNHNSSPVKRIFLGSNVEMLVNHSELPVLSIDFK